MIVVKHLIYECDALTGVMDLPQSIQSQVFSEILDDDVQKGILFLYVPYI